VELQERLAMELTYAFGGCTFMPGLTGSFLSRLGLPVDDRVNLLYVDTPFSFDSQFADISLYTDILRQVVFAALEEEAVLVAAYKVHHSE
jgi:hypothetical protein